MGHVPSPPRLTLPEAHAQGMFGDRNYEAVRKAVQRAALEPAGKRGLEPQRDWQAQHEENERRRLVHALAAAHGNKARAARALGMPRSTFISKLEKHGLVPGRV